jgi:hypothetical protein
MTTKLDRPLKREITVNEKAFTLTITPDGLKLVEKGRRNGIDLDWKSLVSGDAAVSSSLNASLARQ